MGFEVFERGAWASASALESGVASLSRTGTLTALAEDLAVLGIDRAAVVLLDREGLRIAMRKPRDGEADKALSAAVVKSGGRDLGRRRISLGRAVKHLGLTPEATAGRYTLRAKDDLLIIDLQSGAIVGAREVAALDARAARETAAGSRRHPNVTLGVATPRRTEKGGRI